MGCPLTVHTTQSFARIISCCFVGTCSARLVRETRWASRFADLYSPQFELHGATTVDISIKVHRARNLQPSKAVATQFATFCLDLPGGQKAAQLTNAVWRGRGGASTALLSSHGADCLAGFLDVARAGQEPRSFASMIPKSQAPKRVSGNGPRKHAC